MSPLVPGRLGVVAVLLVVSMTACGRRDAPESALADRAVAKSELIDDAPADEALTDSLRKTLDLDPAAKPMNMSVQVDSVKGVSELIGPDGGVLTVTGADGTKFTLEIPKKALLGDTIIAMTPVTNLSGLPFSGGLVGAVQLHPQGLNLWAPAVLSIAAPQPVPVKEQIAFGSESDGRDVHLVPMAPGMDRARLQILHFSTDGSVKPAPGALQFEGGSIKWAEGVWPTPKTPRDRYQQEVARAGKEKDMLDALGYDPDSPAYQKAIKTAAERVRAARFLWAQDLARRLKAAEAHCSDVESVGYVLAEYYAFPKGDARSALEALAQRVSEHCARDALKRCRAGEVLGGQRMFAFQRMYEFLGIGDAYTDEEMAEFKKCLPKWSGRVTYKHTLDFTGADPDGSWVVDTLALLPWTDGFVGTNTVGAEFRFWGKSGGWSGVGKIADDEDDCITVTSSISGQGKAKLSISDARTGEDWDPLSAEELPSVGVKVRSDGSYSVKWDTGELTGKSFYDRKGGSLCKLHHSRSSVIEERHSATHSAQGQADPSNPNVISGSKTITRNEGSLTLTWNLHHRPDGKD